jgi:type IV secretory pathway VirB6-like protein
LKALIQKIRKLKNLDPRVRAFVFALAVAVGYALLSGTPAMAQSAAGTDDPGIMATVFYGIINNLLLWTAALLGKLLLVVIDILIGVAQYNDFVNAPAVVQGWTIVRDVSNMFFIIVLLIIAFGTILKIEAYRFNKLLGKLVLMAILINFSKFIAGFFIDVAQVVMLTFVNAFKDAAAGNFTEMLQLRQMLKFRDSTANVTGGDIFGALIIAIIFVLIALAVMVVMLVMLIIRIVMLWILVVLSPLAYLLATFPSATRYSSQWWSTFWKYLVTGPVMAFFIWLALAFTTETTTDFKTQVESKVGSTQTQIVEANQTPLAASVSSLSESSNILTFVISIAMLMGGLMVAQQLGGAAGNFAGSVAGKISKAGSAPLRLAGGALGAAGLWTAKRADDAQAGLQKRLAGTQFGKNLAQGRLFKEGSRLGKVRDAIPVPRFGKWMAKRINAEGMRKGLTMHGVQMRAIPTAWKQRGAKKEEQRLGEAASVGQDIMNRFFGGYLINKAEKTDYATLGRAARSRKVQSEIEAGGEEKEILLYKLEHEFMNKDGSVKADKVAEAEAVLRTLLNNHDLNEALKMPLMAKILASKGLDGGAVTQTNLQAMLQHMFGESGDTIRIAQNLEEIGLAKNDAWVKGITTWDEHAQDFRWTTAEEGAEISARYNAKGAGRQYVAKQRRQNRFEERADSRGRLTFRSMSDPGKKNFKYNTAQELKTKLEHFQPEDMQTAQENLDVFIDFERQMMETGEFNDVQLRQFHQWIARAGGSSLGMTEKDIDDMVEASVDPEKNEQSRAEATQKLNQIIIDAVEKKQDFTYWKELHSINQQRQTDGITDLSADHEINDEAAYTKALETGSTKGINKRLDWLRSQEVASVTQSKEPSTVAEIVVDHAVDNIHKIDELPAHDIGSLIPEVLAKSQESISKAISDLGQGAGMGVTEFSAALGESIEKLKTSLEQLPEHLKQEMSTSFGEMNTMAQAGRFTTPEDQLKVYYVLKGVQTALEKKNTFDEKKNNVNQNKQDAGNTQDEENDE